MTRMKIVRGGITIQVGVAGNLIIQCRGNGHAECQRADVVDLIAALAECQRLGPNGETSATETVEVIG